MVDGVALELLHRLFFTKGSNPSFSFSAPSPNSQKLLNKIVKDIYKISDKKRILSPS